jgi:hypothetical protein
VSEPEVPVVYVNLPPTSLIALECSTCAHPFRVRSHAAMDAARADHFQAVHSAALAEAAVTLLTDGEE